MRNLVMTLIACLLFTFSTSLLTAQTGKDRLYQITTTEIHPSKLRDYEKAVTKLGEAMVAAEVTTVELHANRTNDLTYYYAEPINNMEELFTNKWIPIIEKVGEKKFMDLFSKVLACEKTRRDDFYLYKAALSHYHPSLKGQSQNYRVWTAYQFKPGSQKEAEALSKAAKAIYQKHDIAMNYSIYFGVLGENSNIVLWLETAKDALTYAQQKAKANKKLWADSEFQALNARLLAILDKMEIKRGYYLPEFSNVPKVTTAVAEKEDE